LPGIYRIDKILVSTLKPLFHLVLVLSATTVAMPAPLPTAPDVIVANYCAAARHQEHSLDGASMEVEIEASLPRLKKQGRLHALRRISALGRITYEHLRFDGDRTVKNEVIARYLTAETEAQKDASMALDVTPANYKFKYKGLITDAGREVHIFQVTPKKKRVGLFRGELWIDAATYLRVRESGSFVKNPSIFVKKIEFVRKYEIRDGISVPLETHSLVDTRLVGKAEINIAFSNVALGAGDPASGSTVTVDGQ
jgi:hypothetical protein